MGRRKSSKRPILPFVLVGCLALMLIGGGLSYFAYLKVRVLCADFIKTAMVATVDASSISEEQKQEIEARLTALAEGFKNRDVSLGQLVRVGEELSQSPIFPVGLLIFLEEGCLEKADLTDEEKNAAALDFQRLARASVEGKITNHKIFDLIGDINDEEWSRRGGRRRPTPPNEMFNPEDCEAVIDAVRAEAALLNLPAEPYEVDFAPLLDDVFRSAGVDPLALEATQ
jgi:hypothetical protein